MNKKDKKDNSLVIQKSDFSSSSPHKDVFSGGTRQTYPKYPIYSDYPPKGRGNHRNVYVGLSRDFWQSDYPFGDRPACAKCYRPADGCMAGTSVHLCAACAPRNPKWKGVRS